jgi:hypothetical protein
MLERLLVRLSAVAVAAAGSGAWTRITARELEMTLDKARLLLRPLGKDIEGT